MSGFCNTPGHQDRPARLYPCGWRCEGCAPGRKERSSAGRSTDNKSSPTTSEGQPR